MAMAVMAVDIAASASWGQGVLIYKEFVFESDIYMYLADSH
jgi:hypothetical protein